MRSRVCTVLTSLLVVSGLAALQSHVTLIHQGSTKQAPSMNSVVAKALPFPECPPHGCVATGPAAKADATQVADGLPYPDCPRGGCVATEPAAKADEMRVADGLPFPDCPRGGCIVS